MALTSLIETWNRQRSLSSSLKGVTLSAARTMELWEPVALWMHEHCSGGVAPRRELVARLAERMLADGLSHEDALATVESYLDTAARWAGILVERGPNTFGFLHQTFQEYLAARALINRMDRESKGAYDILRPYFFVARWREVLLLAVGYLAAVQQRTTVATQFITQLRATTDLLEPYCHRHLLLAAQILNDAVPIAESCLRGTLLELVGAVPSGAWAIDQDLAGALSAKPESGLADGDVPAVEDAFRRADRYSALRRALLSGSIPRVRRPAGFCKAC